MPQRRERASRLWLIAGILAAIAGLVMSGLWFRQGRQISASLAEGDLAYARADWNRSGHLARERLKVAADDPQALRLLARSSARQDRDQAAIATYARLELAAMTGEDYFLLGRALGRTGQDDLAIKTLEASQSAEPDRPEMLDTLAQVYLRKQRPGAAGPIARRLAERPGWEARGAFLLGTCRAELRDPAAAADALRRAFELDPGGKAASPGAPGPLRLLLVRSLLQSAQPSEARRILESDPATSSSGEAAWLLSRSWLQEKSREKVERAGEAAGSYRLEHPLEPEPAPYIGAARCASCHREEADRHLASRHSTTFSDARAIRKLPWPDHTVTDPGDPKVTHAFRLDDRAVKVETRTDRRIYRAVVNYAFGSADHFATPVGTDEQGQDRMLRLSRFDSPKGSGWDLTTGLPAHPPSPDEFLGAAMPPVDGLRGCLQCHTTNPHAIETGKGPEAADHAIGCEVCHGPGGNHVLAVDAKLADPAIISPGRADAAAINGLCGLCHSLNNSTNFAAGPDDPESFRFQLERMKRSRCYIESGEGLHCLSCHEPHADAEKQTATNEAKCLSCHAPARDRTLAAGKPCPVNPSRGCIDCHMPRAWVQGTHSLKIDHFIRIKEKAVASK
jgi:tetratricopeptide (TPR) repeat protein